MTHTIIFFSGQRVLREIAWETGLVSAQAYACNHLAIRKANRAEVQDDTGTTVLCITDISVEANRPRYEISGADS